MPETVTTLMRLPTLNPRLPLHMGIATAFALVPVWYRLPGSADSFSATYSAGFLLFWPMLWTVGWWLALGLPGFAALRRDPARRLWALALLLLALWAFLSATWSYTRAFRPEVTAGAALPLGVAALFAAAVACAGSPRQIVTTLCAGLLWNAALAGLQVALQGPVGLRALGEFAIYPQQSGVSVVLAEGVRWLRPYGLLPHPNILAGFLVVGLLAALRLAFSPGRRAPGAGGGLLLAGLWALLLTFSRAAWIGLAAAGAAILPLLWRARRPGWAVRAAALLGLSLVAAGLFAALYWPFLANRAGVGDDASLELRSISDRAIFADFARQAISESPLIGVGIGNFPWKASRYLRFTAFDLRGQPVHQVYLSAWAELGLVGLGLLAVALGTGVEAALRARRRIEQTLLLGAVIALAIIGLFDHYPWTLLQFQALWWGLLAAAGRPDEPLTAPG